VTPGLIFVVEAVTVRAMPQKPLGDRAMTPAERQRRRRARLAAERVPAADRFAPPPELDRMRGNLGTIAGYVGTLARPETLARVLADTDGPMLPINELAAAGAWLTRFAVRYRVAALLRRTSLTEMTKPASDAPTSGGHPDRRD
jgi:hypothetical protein